MFVLWWLGAAAMLHAQPPDVHYWHQGVLPPGAIGSRQLQRGGPLPGFFQPVEIQVPPGAEISLAVADRFDQSRPGPRKVGMLIGAVYRMRVTRIRLAEGAEVFPTIEVIDRLYAPVGQELRFPLPIDVTEADLKLALAGKFVTRVIYLEDPRHALPVRQLDKSQNWFEAAPGQDPLAVADGLGRPVAILRLGARLPNQGPDPFFFFGSPPFMPFPGEQATPPLEQGTVPTEEAAASKRVKQAVRRSAGTVLERPAATIVERPAGMASELPPQRAAAIGTAVDSPENPLRTSVDLPAQRSSADGVAVQLPRQSNASQPRAAIERPPQKIPLPTRGAEPPPPPRVNNLPPPPSATDSADAASARCQPARNTGLAAEGLRQS